MIKLINGRGQLGSELAELIKNISCDKNIVIYHTWNFLDKSEKTQRGCYESFVDFVDKNPQPKIVFTSTYSQTDNPYNHYKQLSEAYLIIKQNGYSVRLPTLIGKGICMYFRDDDVEAFGEMELMTVKDAASKVLEFALSNSRLRNFRVYGEKVSAKLAKELITFGKNGK